MAVFLSRASQQYAARQNPYVVSATIPQGALVNGVKVTLTREAWPVGPVGNVTMTFPDGATAGFSFDGGDVQARGGGILAATDCMFERFDKDGNPVPFPAGSYSLAFRALQTVRTAVTVERF